jgi:hypothetical protein
VCVCVCVRREECRDTRAVTRAGHIPHRGCILGTLRVCPLFAARRTPPRRRGASLRTSLHTCPARRRLRRLRSPGHPEVGHVKCEKINHSKKLIVSRSGPAQTRARPRTHARTHKHTHRHTTRRIGSLCDEPAVRRYMHMHLCMHANEPRRGDAAPHTACSPTSAHSSIPSAASVAPAWRTITLARPARRDADDACMNNSTNSTRHRSMPIYQTARARTRSHR